jgi:hypothetical protein
MSLFRNVLDDPFVTLSDLTCQDFVKTRGCRKYIRYGIAILEQVAISCCDLPIYGSC